MEIHHIAALVLAGLACVTDLRTRRIPNVLTFGAPLLAVGFSAVTDGWAGVGSALAGWTVGCALFLPMFALRILGSGDVKFLAALGAWLGPLPVAFVGIYGAIASGVILLAVSADTGHRRTALSNLRAVPIVWQTAGVRMVPELGFGHASATRTAHTVPVLTGLAVMLWLR